MCNLTFRGRELQESALSTPESSYVSPVPTVSLDAPVSIYLSVSRSFLPRRASAGESATSLCNCFCRRRYSCDVRDRNIGRLKCTRLFPFALAAGGPLLAETKSPAPLNERFSLNRRNCVFQREDERVLAHTRAREIYLYLLAETASYEQLSTMSTVRS